ncbi:MAG: HopJ type III effector protein [Thiotrichales bacterium]
MKHTEALIARLRSEPGSISFDQVMAVIAAEYEYAPQSFTNGLGDKKLFNAAGMNEGSCKLFAFADMNDLNEAETLALFGDYYRVDVLGDLTGTSHANIRNFMRFGWNGILFDAPPLKLKDF